MPVLSTQNSRIRVTCSNDLILPIDYLLQLFSERLFPVPQRLHRRERPLLEPWLQSRTSTVGRMQMQANMLRGRGCSVLPSNRVDHMTRADHTLKTTYQVHNPGDPT